MTRPRFLYGPRDNGPADPPAWPELVMTALGLLVAFTALGIGLSCEWIGAVYVRGPCAFLFIIGLMIPLCFAGEGFDKARERGELEDQN